MKQAKTYTFPQIFEKFSAEDLQFLKSHTTRLKIKRGEPLFLAGAKAVALYAVASGCFKSVRETQGGHSLIIRIVGPGKLVGLRELFVEFIYQRTCIALQDSEVFVITANAITELIKKNSNVGLHFITLFSHELMRMENMLESHLNQSAKKRLAAILYDFYQIFTPKGSNSFVSPLQRKDLAELAGMTPETVSRSLHDFKKEKILQTTGKSFTILDVPTLKNYDE